MEANLRAFAASAGMDFSDPALLERALTHPSCRSEDGDNQRLEFLGDAVLDLVIAAALFSAHPGADEGDLDRMRAAIVNGTALSARARELGIDTVLRTSEAQAKHLPEPSDGMIEDALEALIGAVYLDAGFPAAEAFVRRHFDAAIRGAAEETGRANPKTRLQEWTQNRFDGALPEYRQLEAEGPDHRRVYSASVHFRGEEIGRGSGSSRKAAEAAAADDALKRISEE